MRNEGSNVEELFNKLNPVMLPPAEYPPAIIVRDTPRDEILQRIKNNGEKIAFDLTDDHWDVINFLFDFYTNCCDTKDPGYLNQKTYWKYVDCLYDEGCRNELDGQDEGQCPYGKLSPAESINAYRIYRILLNAYKEKGGSAHLYRLFPAGPLFTIHLLASLPRLQNDVDPHFGTAY